MSSLKPTAIEERTSTYAIKEAERDLAPDADQTAYYRSLAERLSGKLEEAADAAKVNADKARAAEADSFTDRLLSPEGIATGIGSLVALAAGEEGLAAGMAYGGVTGAAKSARSLKQQRQDRIDYADRVYQDTLNSAAGGAASFMNPEVTMRQQNISRSMQNMSIWADMRGAELSSEDAVRLQEAGFKNGFDMAEVKNAYDHGLMDKDQRHDVRMLRQDWEQSFASREHQAGIDLTLQDDRQAADAYMQAARHVHEGVLQGNLFSHQEKMDAFDKKFRSSMQEDSQSHEIVMQTADQVFRKEERLGSQAFGEKMRYVEEAITKRITSYSNAEDWTYEQKEAQLNYMLQLAEKDPGFLALLAEDNPKLQDFIEDVHGTSLGQFTESVQQNDENELLKKTQIDLANVAVARGEYSEAITLYVGMGVDDPNVHNALVNLQNKADGKERETAVGELHKAILPYMSEASVVAYADILHRTGNRQEAAKVLRPREGMEEYNLESLQQREATINNLHTLWVRDQGTEAIDDPVEWINTVLAGEPGALANLMVTGGVEDIANVFVSTDRNRHFAKIDEQTAQLMNTGQFASIEEARKVAISSITQSQVAKNRSWATKVAKNFTPHREEVRAEVMAKFGDPELAQIADNLFRERLESAPVHMFKSIEEAELYFAKDRDAIVDIVTKMARGDAVWEGIWEGVKAGDLRNLLWKSVRANFGMATQELIDEKAKTDANIYIGSKAVKAAQEKAKKIKREKDTN